MKPDPIRSILVPVDFSSTAINALQTAIAIAKDTLAGIHLLYVDDQDFTLFETDTYLHPPRVEEYTDMLGRLARSVSANHGIGCNFSTESGAVTYSILKTAIHLSSDLIVIGKHGNNNYAAEFAGSHACQVAERSRIPVIIVPSGIHTLCFRSILFPVRPLLSVPEKYDALRPLLAGDQFTLTMLALCDPECEQELHIIHRLNLLMKMKLEDDNVPYGIQYHFKDNHFEEHILNEIASHTEKYDLLVISAELDIYQKDFYVSSYTRKLIHQSPIPVMVMRPFRPAVTTKKVLFTLEKEMVLDV